VTATLYGIPGCPHTVVASLLLERRKRRYRRVDLLPGPHALLVRHVLRFPADTVPALSLDGEKLQETRTISRRLRLIPAHAAAAEEWAELALRPLKRDLLWWSLALRPEAASSFVPYPLPPAIQRLIVWAKPPDEAAARRALATVPAALGRVDELIDVGVIGTDEPNSADLHAAVLVRLISLFDDLRPQLTGRPALALAERLCPPGRYPGRVPRFL
jgi:glutaredoxin